MGAVIVYVPAAKTIIAQLGALEIVLWSVLWLMPLFTLTVGPPHPVGAGVGVGVGGAGAVGDALTVSEVFAVAEE
jgi:hypothetical protein